MATVKVDSPENKCQELLKVLNTKFNDKNVSSFRIELTYKIIVI